MTKLRPYLQLIRFPQPAGTLLLIWPPLWCLCLLSGGDWPPLDVVTAFVLGAFFMRSAGCVVNDITDRELDALVERTKNRPLASGAVSLKHAYVLLAGLLLCALAVAVSLGWMVLLAAFVALPLIAAYPWMKRITFWPQLFLGLTFNYGVLLASIALTGEIQPAAWLLYAAAVFWTLGYDTIYGFQDIKDDEKIGVKSTARLFRNHARQFIAACFSVFVLLVGAAFYASAPEAVFPTEDFLLLCVAIGFHVAWQVYRLNIAEPKTCLMLFKQNATVVGPALVILMLAWSIELRMAAASFSHGI